MASVEHEPITGVWGRAPCGVQGQSPWWAARGASPPEAEGFQTLDVEKRQQICRVLAFWELELA